jgi:hypothetical protein
MAGELPEFSQAPPTAAELADAETCAELMRRAASRIDSYALGEAWDYDQFEEDGPYYVILDDVAWDDDADMPTVATLGNQCADQTRAGWIARMGPQIARPLADLLHAGAVDATEIGPDFRLVALARALMG